MQLIIRNAWLAADQTVCGALRTLHDAWCALPITGKDLMYRRLRWELRETRVRVYWLPGYGLTFHGLSNTEINDTLAGTSVLSQARAAADAVAEAA